MTSLPVTTLPTYADRELVTVSALSGLENVMPQLQAHVRGALNMGVTREQLRAIPASLKAAGLVAESLRCEASSFEDGSKMQEGRVIHKCYSCPL